MLVNDGVDTSKWIVIESTGFNGTNNWSGDFVETQMVCSVRAVCGRDAIFGIELNRELMLDEFNAIQITKLMYFDSIEQIISDEQMLLNRNILFENSFKCHNQ